MTLQETELLSTKTKCAAERAFNGISQDAAYVRKTCLL